MKIVIISIHVAAGAIPAFCESVLSFEFMVQNQSNRVPRLVQFATASTIRRPEFWTKFPALRPIEHNRTEEWIPKHTLERARGGGHQAGRKQAVKLSPRRASVEGRFRLQAMMPDP